MDKWIGFAVLVIKSKLFFAHMFSLVEALLLGCTLAPGQKLQKIRVSRHHSQRHWSEYALHYGFLAHCG